jgi:poly(3-hydroxybutyrate) depolymerase
MLHRDERVDCSKIRNTAIITIEGENDDICGIGQTEAAHDICNKVAPEDRFHYVQPGVGHYGVFNGKRWRTEIQPRLRDQIRAAEARHSTLRNGAPTNVSISAIGAQDDFH